MIDWLYEYGMVAIMVGSALALAIGLLIYWNV